MASQRNRSHDDVYMAVHKMTGKMYGGKKNGTHIGYSKVGALKSAMTLDKLNRDDYHFVKLSFVPDSEYETDEIMPIVPELTILEEDN